MEDLLSKTSSDSNEEVHSKELSRDSAIVSLLGYVLPPAVALTVLLVAWEVLVRLADVPVYIVPRPTQVLDRLMGDLSFFGSHGVVTLLEAMGGFLVGVRGCLQRGDFDGPLSMGGADAVPPGPAG